MEILVANSRVDRLCQDPQRRITELGPVAARKLEQRLMQIRAAESLQALSMIPGLNPHPLAGDRAGEIAVTVHRGVRLVFIPAHDPLPRTPDGGLDRSAVTAVCITEIGDYHRG